MVVEGEKYPKIGYDGYETPYSWTWDHWCGCLVAMNIDYESGARWLDELARDSGSGESERERYLASLAMVEALGIEWGCTKDGRHVLGNALEVLAQEGDA